jgi:hypothetical protein
MVNESARNTVFFSQNNNVMFSILRGARELLRFFRTFDDPGSNDRRYRLVSPL